MTPRIAALSRDDLVRLLRTMGSRTITLESLAADIDAGAPVNADGTLNLIEYAAWILGGGANAE